MTERLKQGSILGLTGARALLDTGFLGKDAAEEYPINEISDVLRSGVKHKDLHSILVPEIDGPGKKTGECWSIVSTIGMAKIEATAREIVRLGIDTAGSIPLVRFGKFTAITLSEIESYRTIQRLIREYRDAGVQDRPLCIGVFGRPGSGKSYGLKKVVGHILGDDVPSMTFNLSEFRDARELSRAFHLIHNATRDRAVPLVFFDEFDCSLGNGLCGWLKYFLAPMQDGVFNDGVDTHPIGRAIFVFAGGTCYDYRQFASQSPEAWFINAKGPDFLSRLRGYIDIAGTEPVGPKDHSCLLRRAIMLRVGLEERTKTLSDKAHWLLDADKKIHIDEDVLRAFLKVHSYRNSVRSMTGIIETSELSSSRGFTKAALPPDDLLDMYTDSRSFRQIVNLAPHEELIFLPAREELARLVHERYWKRNKDEKGGDPKTKVPWAELAEHHREQNRSQVDRIVEYLSKIGCTVELAELVQKPYELTEDDILEIAKLEHDRWYREKKALGYHYGEERDDIDLTHPDMLPWEEVFTKERQKDIDAMRDVPLIMARVGLSIIKIK
jgi:hypothetical protein